MHLYSTKSKVNQDFEINMWFWCSLLIFFLWTDNKADARYISHFFNCWKYFLFGWNLGCLFVCLFYILRKIYYLDTEFQKELMISQIKAKDFLVRREELNSERIFYLLAGSRNAFVHFRALKVDTGHFFHRSPAQGLVF